MFNYNLSSRVRYGSIKAIHIFIKIFFIIYNSAIIDYYKTILRIRTVRSKENRNNRSQLRYPLLPILKHVPKLQTSAVKEWPTLAFEGINKPNKGKVRGQRIKVYKAYYKTSESKWFEGFLERGLIIQND